MKSLMAHVLTVMVAIPLLYASAKEQKQLSKYMRFMQQAKECQHSDVPASLFYAVKALKENPDQAKELSHLLNQGVAEDLEPAVDAIDAPLQGMYTYYSKTKDGEYVRFDAEYRLAAGSLIAQERQKEIADKYSLAIEVESKKMGIRFRLIPPQNITMVGRSEYGNTHRRVPSSGPFYVGKFEITQEQWTHVMGCNPSAKEFRNPQLPVNNVLWSECETFVKKLCELENVAPGTYRLLYQTEWGVVARAGTKGRYYFGEKADTGLANVSSSFPNGDYQGNIRIAFCLLVNTRQTPGDFMTCLAMLRSLLFLLEKLLARKRLGDCSHILLHFRQWGADGTVTISIITRG